MPASLDFLGQAAHPQVSSQIELAIKAIDAAGKAAGILTTTPELAKKYMHCGALFVGVGVETLLLANASFNLAVENKPASKAAKKSKGAY